MGFFSNIKNRARGMPMAPQPMQELRAGQIMPNSPQLDRSSSPSRMPAPPARFDRATAPVLNPGNIGGNLGSDFRMPQKPSGLGGLLPQQNLDFLNKLPQNMMPNLDFSNLPQNMRPGFVAGGPLSRAALSNIYRKNATARGIPVPGNLQSIYTSSLPYRLRRGTENLIMGGTGAGVLLGLDGTQELREPFSKDNLGFMSPEAFGKDMAQLRMDVGAVINLAKNKANEIGADINEYVSRAKQSYEQEMENKRMQELDAQQGMQPFSALLGPDMPLRRPELTEGRTTSDIDDILSSLEKKKLDNPPEESISVKDVTDIFFDPTDPIDYAALASGPFIKAGLSAKKAKKLYDGLQKIKQQKRQAQTDYRRGQAEYNAGEPQGAKLMSKSQEKFNRLSVNEAKITKQLEGYQPEIL